MPITGTNGKEIVKMLRIYYPIRFQENLVRTLLDTDSKINAMNPAFARKLGLYIQKANIRAQKIDSSALETFEIKIADFQVENKIGRPKFFQETFLVANTKFEVILGMLFLKISNADVVFGKKTLT